jgi:hypothetical protein
MRQAFPMRCDDDMREPIQIDLRVAGGRNYVIEPVRGYVAWKLIDADSREVLRRCALKEALHWIADQMPRQLAVRNLL